MKSHYHVVENTPGYLPESDSSYHTSRKSANAAALSLARELREDGYKVTGSAGDYYGERNSSDLGRVIEVIPCCEGDCTGDE